MTQKCIARECEEIKVNDCFIEVILLEVEYLIDLWIPKPVVLSTKKVGRVRFIKNFTTGEFLGIVPKKYLEYLEDRVIVPNAEFIFRTGDSIIAKWK